MDLILADVQDALISLDCIASFDSDGVAKIVFKCYLHTSLLLILSKKIENFYFKFHQILDDKLQNLLKYTNQTTSKIFAITDLYQTFLVFQKYSAGLQLRTYFFFQTSYKLLP